MAGLFQTFPTKAEIAGERQRFHLTIAHILLRITRPALKSFAYKRSDMGSWIHVLHLLR
jgi:hypothetical protein